MKFTITIERSLFHHLKKEWPVNHLLLKHVTDEPFIVPYLSLQKTLKAFQEFTERGIGFKVHKVVVDPE